MRIAIEGCCHGELDKIYETIAELERRNQFKVDLLLICGDFQAVRNYDDFQALAVPFKYQKLNTFYKYYSGEKKAPLLTIFVGGNHEASNFMQELPYGGFVAPNIYYLGYAGIIQVGGVRIGGISGIHKSHDYCKGHYERAPYSEGSKRSVYHIRNLEVFRMKQISRHVDIFMSHDWPRGIHQFGDWQQLVRFKKFLKKEVDENSLGAQPLSDVLNHVQPSYWFAAHLHVKFAAHVQHKAKIEGSIAKSTKFLALDKCLPRRRFLQIMEIPHKDSEGLKIKLDPEWLSILQNTDHLWSFSPSNTYMPGPSGKERYDFSVSDTEIEKVKELFGHDLTLPEKFTTTAPPFTGRPNPKLLRQQRPLRVLANPQTTLLCAMLDITDPNAKFLGKSTQDLLEKSDFALPDSPDQNSNSDEGPSFIDSSIDVSNSTPNTSIMKDTPDKKQPVSTPSLKLNLPQPQNIMDTDDELLSILSAQKLKSSNKTENGEKLKNSKPTIADRLKTLKNKNIDSTSANYESDFPSLVKSDTLNLNSGTMDSKTKLDANNSISGLTPDISRLFPESISSKRKSSEDSSASALSGEESSSSSGGIRLKRRNVSLYSD